MSHAFRRPAAHPEPLEARRLLSVVTYDLKAQWSDSANPNGTWAYREGTHALPHVANWDGFENPGAPAQPAWARADGSAGDRIFLPSWFKATRAAGDWKAGDVVVHTTDFLNGQGAGPANVSWKSPAAGTVVVSGGVWDAMQAGRAAHWSLLKNNTELTAGDVFDGDAFSRANPLRYSSGSKGARAVENITVVPGDTLQLQVITANAADFGDMVGVTLAIRLDTSAAGTVRGTVFNDAVGNGKKDSGDGGMQGVKVFVDANQNARLDAGEKSAVTNSAGAYTIAAVAPGPATVRAVTPAGYRATTAVPVVVGVTPGVTTTANFGMSQTALIAGSVFNDLNRNRVRDAGEKGLAGVVVFLDLNGNGELDFLDLKTTTDASGNFRFAVPFGRYTIRHVPASGSSTTTPVARDVTVSKGQVVATGSTFGDRRP